MQMDSYYYGLHDEIPGSYAPAASPELPFGLDDAAPLFAEPPNATAEAPSGTAFLDYYYGAEGGGGGQEAIHAGARQQGIDGSDMMEMDREQCRVRETDEARRRRREPGTVESSRGFRHMMRERQRREKLSQSYADLYALVAARSKGDKNSIVQSAAMYIHELKGAREQLQRRNEELKGRILGHDARQPSVKLEFEVDDPASGIDSMIGALRRLKTMGVKARGIRSTMCGDRLWTEMNVETTIAASEVEKAVEEALMKEVQRKQPQPDADSGAAAPFPGTSSSSSWAATHVQNVF